jgi:hypothetical protein
MLLEKVQTLTAEEGEKNIFTSFGGLKDTFLTNLTQDKDMINQ